MRDPFAFTFMFILTSNLGRTQSRPAIGFEQVAGKERPRKPEQVVRSTFRPELSNRLDAIVAFNPPSIGDVAKIPSGAGRVLENGLSHVKKSHKMVLTTPNQFFNFSQL
jgi:ATP-dependent Clp protease ATP-binding subunit ClpA